MLKKIDTQTRAADSCSAAELRREVKTAWIGPDAERHVTPDRLEFYREVTEEDGPFSGAMVRVSDPSHWKTPLNIAIADAMPERKFVRQLCDARNAKFITAWLKNKAQGFYKIDYAWKRNEHARRGEFSPDFFILIGSTVHVVEIKGDEEVADPAPENAKKQEYAERHFALLNKWLAESSVGQVYQFNFLTPEDYPTFFEMLRQGKLGSYRSRLDAALAELR